MLPGKAIDPGATATINRQFIETVRRRFRTESPWRDLPERVRNRNSVFERFPRRAVSGVFERVFHAPCQIQTLRLGCLFSQDAGPKPCPSFICTSGPAIAAVEAPLMKEGDAGRRSQVLSVPFLTHDAPRADELVVAPRTAMPNRPSHRVGDRNQDLEDLGNYVDNPTAVRDRRHQLHSCRHGIQAVSGSRRRPASGGMDGASQRSVGDAALPRL
ncbi:MAG: transposase [Boseongicola sp. SB0662_bin_57]|nr:transposase [Boseongicola sp. SB0662_bin_57]